MQESIHNLKTMNLAKNYNKWIFQTIKPFLGKKILEVGCGIGNMSQFLLDSELLVGIDISAVVLDIIRERFSKTKNIDFFNYNITNEKLADELKKYNFDTVVLVNVLEHIKDDVQALRNCSKLLLPGGKIIVFAPAFQSFFGSIDRADLHFRRYSKSDIARTVENAGFKVKRVFYKDVFAVPLWLFHNKILRTPVHPKGQMSFFDMFVPVCAFIEKILPPLIGLSVVV